MLVAQVLARLLQQVLLQQFLIRAHLLLLQMLLVTQVVGELLVVQAGQEFQVEAAQTMVEQAQ